MSRSLRVVKGGVFWAEGTAPAEKLSLEGGALWEEGEDLGMAVCRTGGRCVWGRLVGGGRNTWRGSGDQVSRLWSLPFSIELEYKRALA